MTGITTTSEKACGSNGAESASAAGATGADAGSAAAGGAMDGGAGAATLAGRGSLTGAGAGLSTCSTATAAPMAPWLRTRICEMSASSRSASRRASSGPSPCSAATASRRYFRLAGPDSALVAFAMTFGLSYSAASRCDISGRSSS